jgi:branched-chain amino acid transport system substrate-binding protein
MGKTWKFRWVTVAPVALAMSLCMPMLSAGSAGAASSKPTGTPIVIGTIETQTGTPGTTGRVTTGTDIMKVWAKWTNAHGGVSGHPVQVIALNDNADPAQAKTDLSTLVEQDNVLAIVGHDASTTEPTWGPYMLAHRTPVIGGAAYSANWFTNPMFYPATTTVVSNIWAQVYLAKQLVKNPRIAYLLCLTTVCQGALPIEAAAAKQLSIPIVYNQTADSAAVSYTPQCLAMKAAGANVVQPDVNNVLFIRDCQRQGYRPLVIATNYGPIPSNILANPKQLAGQVGPAPAFPPFEQFPATKAYFSALKAYAPQYLPGASAYVNTNMQAAVDAWVAGQAFAKAIANAAVPASATVTRADLIRGLSMFKGETLGGITPALTYGDGTTPSPQVKCFYEYKTVNSKVGYVTIPPHKLVLTCQP